MAETAPTDATAALDTPAAPAVEHLSRGIPHLIIENLGQVDRRVTHYLRGLDTSVFFTRHGLTFCLDGSNDGAARRWVLKQDFVDGTPVRPVASEKATTSISYFKGRHEQWKTGLDAFRSLTYRQVWPGIDVTYSSGRDALKQSFVVRPGADPTQIRVRVRGATNAVIGEDGSVIYETPHGTIVDAAPYVFQMVGGLEIEIPSSYDLSVDRQTGNAEIGFSLGEYDPRHELIVDPATLVYSGYIGGTSFDRITDVAVDDDGVLYVVGSTGSDEDTFPILVGPDLEFNGNPDAFVAKVAVDGSGLVWAGYIGGDEAEYGYGIALDAAGGVYVAGVTESDEASFPRTVGPTFGGGEDGFVAKVAADGTDLEYCRYIGGTASDEILDVGVDDLGHAYVTGSTQSSPPSFPVTPGSYRTTRIGYTEAFVAKVDTDGDPLVFCSYLGSNAIDHGWGITVDSSGASYVVGYTQSSQYHARPFPTTDGSFGPSHCGGEEAFLTKFSADGASLIYSGLVCGSEMDRAYDVAIDSTGAAYVAGETDSTQSSSVPFPLVVGPDLTHGGLPGKADGFITKVAPDGGSIVYSGYVGGTNSFFEQILGIDVDDDRNAYVTGSTWSSETTFPVLEGPNLTSNGNGDAFVSRVRADGAAFDYSGFIGGSSGDEGWGIAVDSKGDAYVGGTTLSTVLDDFPVLVGPSLSHNGDYEAFVAKVTFCGHATTLLEDTWTLLSLPCSPGAGGNTVADLFGDDGLGTYDVDWAMLERDEETDRYILLAETDTLVQGAGYWIKVLVGDHVVDNSGSRTDTAADFEIALVDSPSPGRWNMVGHPHAFSVQWADVKVRDEDPPHTIHSVSDAGAASFIEGRWMYKYNGSAYQTYHPDVGSPTLDIFDGFWVRVLDNATLLIPALEGDREVQSAPSTRQWWVRIRVSSGDLEDPGNFLGRMAAALDGQDQHDLPELEPFASPFLTVVFPHSDWAGDHWSYTADFKHLRPGAGGRWELEARSDIAREITLDWASGGVDPDILDRSLLVDEVNGTVVQPSAGSSYSTVMSGPTHRFSWRVNSLPQVDAGPDRSAGVGLHLHIRSEFNDEDPSDTHSATCTWGDGAVDQGSIVDRTVTCGHVYEEVGEFRFQLCVEDDVGGRGCDDAIIDVRAVLFADDFESGDTSAWAVH